MCLPPSVGLEACHWHVGLDAHKRQPTYCFLDAGSRTLQLRTVKGPLEMVLGELAKIKERFATAYEAWRTLGYPFDQFPRSAAKTVVGHRDT